MSPAPKRAPAPVVDPTAPPSNDDAVDFTFAPDGPEADAALRAFCAAMADALVADLQRRPPARPR